jgi:hypothetical protein
MAKKKKGSKKVMGAGGGGKPAILSIARPAKTRSPKMKIGYTTATVRGKAVRVSRRGQAPSKRRGARYKS